MAKLIVIKEQYCLGCKACVLECALAHSDSDTLAEAIRSDNIPQPRIHVYKLDSGAMPLQCRHCQDAPCMKVCPAEALGRASPESPVILDPDRCIGCEVCVSACPFGAIGMSRDGKVAVKCDLCIARTKTGQEPACVASCPTGALKFEELDNYLELDDHLRQCRQRAVAGVCAEPIQLNVITEKCKACGKCVKICPVKCISGGTKKVPAKIDTDKCIRCRACFKTCPFDAVAIESLS
ncbi:MAG: 4Fe-4S binding protein [Planctomycetes bacterium]|nr:4Fe-4S binding protein [Planctomycetota bacterium]